MTFMHAWWLLAGALACCAVAWAWRRVDRRRRTALGQLVAVHLQSQLTHSVSTARLYTKRALFVASVALLFVALAGPQAGYRMELIKRRGNDIIFAVDTSRSMLTPDVKPNRLARAKLAIADFVGNLDGDAVGLVAFAGSAFLQTPITLDYGAFRESLNALDTNIIPRGGTNITSAIQEAQAALARRPGSDKVLILITDGEELEGDAVDAAKAAAQQGLKIYTVGVGTPNGDLIPLPAEQGGGFLKDAAGHLVKSRLDEATLEHIAAASGGIYAPLGNEGQGLDTIYRKALAPLAKHDLAALQHRVYIQRFQLPLAASLLLLIGSLLINNRRSRSAMRANASREAAVAGPATRWRAPASATLASLLGVALLHPAHASPASAEQAYQKGDFAAAEHDYAAAAQHDPRKPTLAFNAGAAAYKAGDFSQSARAFQESLQTAPSADAKRLLQQEDAYYNLGNAQYRTGRKTEAAAPEETLATWTKAVKAYDAALQLRAGDADAKFNRDFVNRKLEALKKQQKQTQNQQSSQNQQPPSNDKSGQQKQPQSAGKQAQQNKEQSAGSSQQQPSHSSEQSKDQQQQAAQNGRQSAHSQHPQPGGQPKSDSQTPEEQKQANQPQPGQPGAPRVGSAGQPRKADAGNQAADDNPRSADNQRAPGQMSREEARELLDSLKADERHVPGQPIARINSQNSAQDQPLKDW